MNAIELNAKLQGRPIDAEHFKIWADANKIPLVETDGKFTVGDVVTYTNEFGVVFKNRTIIGISEDKSWYGRYIYLNSDSWWFPHKPEELRLENKKQ